MVSLAHLVVIRAEAGIDVSRELATVPPGQFGIWFAELAPLCPSRMAMGVERRRANALNVEIGTPLTRCTEQSPDGRGMAWLWSGGSAISYGCCGARECPRAREGG